MNELRGLRLAANQRDRAAALECVAQDQDEPYFVICSSPLADLVWLIDEGVISVDHIGNMGGTILHVAIGNTCLQPNMDQHVVRVAKVCYLIEAKANLELSVASTIEPVSGTALERAIKWECQEAITLLLRAGASTACLVPDFREYLEINWFSCKDACVAAICALRVCTRQKRLLMIKDVFRLIARMLWHTRYDTQWMEKRRFL